MGLIPERKAMKLKQSALLVLAAVFGWIGGFLGFLWAEEMTVGERIIGTVVVTVLILSILYGLISWCWSV